MGAALSQQWFRWTGCVMGRRGSRGTRRSSRSARETTSATAVIPHRALHSVPFHALYDGNRHVLEWREVCLAYERGEPPPCVSRPRQLPGRTVLVGGSDETLGAAAGYAVWHACSRS